MSTTEKIIKESEFLKWLEVECKYRDVRLLRAGKYVAIYPLLLTHAIIIGTIGDFLSYDDRWCYHDYESAKNALDKWNGDGEPQGWHRHPSTGRRIDENGELKIYF